eukprot:scaffold1373_cov367-Pinguiococcus_pyrenoidosus.AAC.9
MLPCAPELFDDSPDPLLDHLLLKGAPGVPLRSEGHDEVMRLVHIALQIRRAEHLRAGELRANAPKKSIGRSVAARIHPHHRHVPARVLLCELLVLSAPARGLPLLFDELVGQDPSVRDVQALFLQQSPALLGPPSRPESSQEALEAEIRRQEPCEHDD